MDRFGIGMLCLALLTPALAQAEVYTWKDASGKMVFSDQPPPNVQARRMNVRAPQAATQASAPDAAMGKGAAAKSAAKGAASDPAAKNAQIDAQNAKIREENCRRAKGNLSTLQQGGRIAMPGTARDLANDKQRAELIRQAQQDAQTWCGSK